MESKHGAWTLVWLVASLSACSGKKTATSGNPTTGTNAAGCTQLINVTCQKGIACEPLISQTVYPDVPSCVAMMSPFCAALDELPGSAGLVADYDACIVAYPSVSCDLLASGNLPAACESKPGTLANGSSCADSSQCQSTYCQFDYSTESDCGLCAPRSPVGGSCQEATGCEKGLVCDSGSATPTCIKPAPAGQTCDSTLRCQSGLYCANGVCAATKGAGAACASITECNVRQGLWCTSGVCQAITLASQGEPCDQAEGTFCRAPAYCGQATDGGSPTCLPRRPNGSACDTMNPCQVGLDCTDGVCAAFHYPTCQ